MKNEHFPQLSNPEKSIIKPQELIDIVEMAPLTLNDRRIFNLLLGHAWNNIHTTHKHTIHRHDLVKYVDSKNQDISLCLRRLMAAIVQIKIPKNRNGEEAIRQIALIGANEIETSGSQITYSFPPELVKIIENTEVFARIHTDVMFQLSSKYSLALYEFIQKRGNLKHINYELISVEELRGLFGVPDKKLKAFGHLNDKAIKPAVKEVSFLSEFEIEAEPIKKGRNVTHIKFMWKRKTDIGKQISSVEELERSKIGRKARLNNDVAQIITNKIHVPPSAIEQAKSEIIASRSGHDIYALERDFIELANDQPPDNIGGAFVGFVRKKIKTNTY